MPTTASIEEMDSLFMACVTLTTSDYVTLDVEVEVELNTVDATGEFECKDFSSDTKLVSLYLAIAMGKTIDMDYLPLINEPVIFVVGDSNGTERCANITIQEDMLVECEEEFNITLSVIKEQPNFILGEATTIVSILDSDGKILSCAN